ncbi:MAG: response regulator transcription factor [Brachyspira sp.]|jgi:narL subfamily protein|nr:response regulator transcription factor [Brachyspira sp.]CCY25025.1 two component transcriptional regulator LuxR family [Brachyspira sp. CAG:484]
MSELANILLVDDNPKYLKDALPFYGYNVQTAADGVQALKLLEKNSFDLILLDVMMPNMNGWETLKAVRKNPETKYTPVIMITAVNEEQKMISGLKTGADDYIIKPFILPNLLARMEAVLRRSKWQTQSIKTNNLPFSTKKKTAPLTNREKEVLALASQGANNKEIAEKLCLMEVTVKSHMNNIFKKLNVTNRTQAVLLAMNSNLTD